MQTQLLDTPFDVEQIRDDFPVMKREMRGGRPIVFLDSAASSQKPRQVIDAITQYYSRQHANVHRGVYQLSQEATDAFEQGRRTVRQFINAAHDCEVIFTRGTTESINLVASSFGRRFLQPGDEVVISAMEHHSNIVPWQLICEERKASLRVVPVNDAGELLMDEYRNLLHGRTRMVAITQVSNSLGTINPVKEIIQLAHERHIPVLLDGAQAIPHLKIDVQELGVDFYAFSGHKVLGPTGIGILYGREQWLNEMPPYQGGGEMIETVTFEKTTYNSLPYKFEAGTPHISGVIGLGAALEYMQRIGHDAIARHEQELLDYGTAELARIEGLRLVGTASHKAGVISFLLDGAHPYDVGTLLDQLGIAVRTGHHCTQPLMARLGIPGTVRASLAFYNNKEDIDRLVDGVRKAAKMLR